MASRSAEFVLLVVVPSVLHTFELVLYGDDKPVKFEKRPVRNKTKKYKKIQNNTIQTEKNRDENTRHKKQQ
jgi:hypothetical protein